VTVEKFGDFTIASEALDCNINLFEARGYGNSIDNSKSISYIKSYVEYQHTAWSSLNGNGMTEQAIPI
jgi:septin family protein